jgi:CheY-like chemotaxis protein
VKNFLKHIVLSEDDEEDVSLFSEALREISDDIRLIIAANGKELMSTLNTVAVPDMIVLDLNMPLKSGAECLEEIRLQEKFNAIPVVILSTSKHLYEMKLADPNDLNYYLSKPWSFNGYKIMIKQMCDGNLIGIGNRNSLL